MEVRLENAVAAIHGTKSTDVKNLVSAAGVFTCAGARFYESAAVSGKKQHFFPFRYSGGITVLGYIPEHFVAVVDNLTGNFGKAFPNAPGKIAVGNFAVDVKFF
jgi:hypothetical protein